MSVSRRDPPLTSTLPAAEQLGVGMELLTSSEQLYALQTEWDALVEESTSPSIFLTWEWISTWWEVFGTDLRPWILVARDRGTGDLLGIAPFLLRQHPLPSGPWRELSLWGSTVAAGDHLNVLVRRGYEDLVAARFAETLWAQRRQWDVLALDWVASGSLLAGRVRQQANRSAMVWRSVCPFVRLPNGWAEFQASLAKNTRRNLIKASHRLNRAAGGAVTFQQVDSVAEVPTVMDELFRLHQELWTARGYRGAFGDAAVRRFHRQIAVRLAEQGRLRLHVLRVRGQAIAVDYGFAYGGTVSLYQGGYDRTWEHYSPGSLVTAETIRAAIAQGDREVDFLRGEEWYKTLWTRTARCDLRLRVASTASGGMLVQAYRVLHAVRAQLRRWRPDGLCSKGAFTCFDGAT